MTLPILVELLVIFAAAKIGAELMVRLRQPAVVGELVAGIVLGPSLADLVHPSGELELLSELGVILLLFVVGLETHPSDLRAVGGPALRVGVLGVALPFAGGMLAAQLAGHSTNESLFVATTLVATSVGVTARVLQEVRALHAPESRVILGAAVIDDILGLVILAIVAGGAAGTLSPVRVIVLVAETLAFVGLVIGIGGRVIARLSDVFDSPKIDRAPFALAIMIAIGLSAAADSIGLAAIIGAFLAGMILSELRGRYEIERQMEPVADFLTPFFFVVTGSQIDVTAFGSASVLAFATVITVVAVAGKVAGGILGAAGMGKRSGLIVGLGMVPRGEVGIIVASLALSSGVIGTDLFSAVIAMVVVTTLVAPPFFTRMMRRPEPEPGAAPTRRGPEPRA